MRQVEIINASAALKSPLVVDYCESFWCKLLGLSYRRSLPFERGLLMDERTESRTATGIHMLGMFFDLTIVWLDSQLKVVDVKPARAWRSYLFPREAARYVLECGASRLEEFRIGHQIEFKDHPDR